MGVDKFSPGSATAARRPGHTFRQPRWRHHPLSPAPPHVGAVGTESRLVHFRLCPPPQTLGWILGLYRDVADIRATGRTIVYCVSQEVGHLAIFVSSKVGAKEDEEFVQLMDVIDCLPPGLFEMVIGPRPENVPAAGFVTGDWIARFEARSLDDVRTLGRNSPEDDRAFAAVARMSERNLSLYRNFMQPFVRAAANQPMADLTKALNPLRMSYTMFDDRNPWMKGVQMLAAAVNAARRSVAADNPVLALQEKVSGQIIAALDAYRDARDKLQEQFFFGFYGSQFFQKLLGIDADTVVRPIPETSPGDAGGAAGPDERLCRDVGDRGFRRGADPGGAVRGCRGSHARSAMRTRIERCAAATHASVACRVQGHGAGPVLCPQLEPGRAVEMLASLVPDADARKELLSQVRTIAGAGDPLTPAERDRLARLSQVLGVPAENPVTSTVPGRSRTTTATNQSEVVLH